MVRKYRRSRRGYHTLQRRSLCLGPSSLQPIAEGPLFFQTYLFPEPLRLSPYQEELPRVVSIMLRFAPRMASLVGNTTLASWLLATYAGVFIFWLPPVLSAFPKLHFAQLNPSFLDECCSGDCSMCSARRFCRPALPQTCETDTSRR